MASSDGDRREFTITTRNAIGDKHEVEECIRPKLELKVSSVKHGTHCISDNEMWSFDLSIFTGRSWGSYLNFIACFLK